MFGDLFGVDAEKINEANRAMTAISVTHHQLLVDKGIFTEEEFASMHARITAMIDQEWARKKEEAKNQFEEDNPGMAKVMEAFYGKTDDA